MENSAERRNVSVTSGKTYEISDTYLDTEDWRIYRAGYALRIRSAKGWAEPEATMKLLASETAALGLKSRREISEVLDGVGSAAPEALEDASGPVGEMVRTLSGPERLRPLFEVETRRSTYALAFEGSEVGEIALDETAIPRRDGAEPTRLRRVEVELDPDMVSRLEPFVGRLREECRLSPAATSKYEAGLSARGLTPPPRDPGPVVEDGGV